ncbi:MAG: BlaI/MecI/CopY family transcriptional regulator [Planctomycetia bacterium]|nr:BlaI/MecI/CopY family transcriptional regulator [Planctomycetia bacterium]
MAKKKPAQLPPLSDSQFEIMREIWKRNEATVSDVWESLVSRRTVARNTILTLMDRLVRKGWLERRVAGQTHLYSAAVSHRSTLGEVAQRVVETAFAGSVDSLMLALIEGRGISDAEAERIRQLIDKARKKSK